MVFYYNGEVSNFYDIILQELNFGLRFCKICFNVDICKVLQYYSIQLIVNQ